MGLLELELLLVFESVILHLKSAHLLLELTISFLLFNDSALFTS